MKSSDEAILKKGTARVATEGNDPILDKAVHYTAEFV